MLSSYKIRQLQFESDTWKRHLAFMSDENVHMKARLVEMLKEKLSAALLHQAENFQNAFIEQDVVIRLLRNSIFAFDRLLSRERVEDGMIINEIITRHQSIEGDLGVAQKKSEELKRSFNCFGLENF